MGAARDCGMERFCPPHVGGGKYRVKFPNKNGRVVTSLQAARVSTGRSDSDMDWVFIDGDVAKWCIGERPFHPQVNPDVCVKFPVNRVLAFRKFGRNIF